MKTPLALIFALGFLTIPARAAVLTIDQAMQIIDDKNVSTMEDLLPLLPQELRSGFSLVRQSRSTQDANDANPRAIMYGIDAKFIAAFNGDPSQAGSDQLEMIQFNDKESAFEFYAIQFPIQRDSSGHAIRPEKNPDRCLVCHGSDPHPNWKSYNSWPGMYGANDDYLEGDELKAFQGFLATRMNHPRYKNLTPAKGSALAPFSYEKRGNETFRPNFRFGLNLGRLNAKRLARIVRASGRLARYAPILAYDVGTAVATQLPICQRLTTSQPIYDGLWTPENAKILQASLDRERVSIQASAPAIPATWDAIKDLYFLYADTPAQSWTLQPDTSSDPFAEFYEGSTTSRSLLMGELRQDIYQVLPELEPYTQQVTLMDMFGGDQRLIRTPFDALLFHTADGIGVRTVFQSPDDAHCKDLIGRIKQNWL